MQLVDLETLEKFNNSSIERIYDIMEVLTTNMMMSPVMYSGIRNELHMYFGSVFASAQNTLKTIDFALHNGNIGDAYTLLRKFRDDFLLGLFIKDSLEKASKTEIENLFNNEKKAVPNKELLDEWFKSKLEKNKSQIDYCKYIEYFNKDTVIKEAYETYLKNYLKKISNELNNYVHGNGAKFSISNIYMAPDLKEFINSLDTLFSVLLSYLILQNSIPLHSSDYEDYVECGMKPPEGSQCWVAPVISDFINEKIPLIHKDLLQYLKDNQKYDMCISGEIE